MPARFYPGAGPYHGRNVSYRGYEPNKAGIARIAVGPELRRAVGELTDAALEYAQLIAPADTHTYQNSFHADVTEADFPDRRGGDPPMLRWVGVVVNDAPNATVVEVGAQHTRPYRVFRRTLEWLELVTD